jgi:hypothetical protein
MASADGGPAEEEKVSCSKVAEPKRFEADGGAERVLKESGP